MILKKNYGVIKIFETGLNLIKWKWKLIDFLVYT